MKKLILFLACAVAAFGATSCAEKTNDIKVISYNVRFSGGDGENHWDKRKHASINMINDEKPTVFGVQEAKADQIAYLRENLPEYGYIGVGREDGKSGGEHMSIFYLKEQVELLDGGTFWLSETPDVPSMGWDAACKRSCTWTKMKMKDTGKEFAYINTHLDHVGKVAQREGLALICKRFAEIVPVGMPAFLTADFNALTNDPIFEPLNAEMKDARVEAPETDNRATYNGFKPGGEDNADLVIDHIFYRGAEAKTFKVLRDKNYGAPFISDHYPVVMTATF
ncbi:MAG: endonuclease/exonuclease/phosphatase family protein [Alistipes sp.]|nr:endonuclease/exonuclease/phosphatase family protein [Alistipes sp.]